jgi:hypothetical protein
MNQNTQNQDEWVSPQMQIGHGVSDAQKFFRRNQFHEMNAPLSFAEAQQMRGGILQGPLPYEQFRRFPAEPTNPFKLKSSPFDTAWTMLKEDVNRQL